MKDSQKEAEGKWQPVAQGLVGPNRATGASNCQEH